MKKKGYKYSIIIFASYLIISCTATKSFTNHTSSRFVSQDLSEMTITDDKFLYEEGYKVPYKYRYKYSLGNVTYNGKTAILNSDEPSELYYRLESVQTNLSVDSLKVKIIGLEDNFENYLDIQLIQSSDIINNIKISKNELVLKKKNTRVYDLFIAPKPLGFNQYYGIDSRSLYIQDVLEFYSWDGDKNTVIIHIDKEKLLQYYSFFEIRGACLSIDGDKAYFRGKVFERVKN